MAQFEEVCDDGNSIDGDACNSDCRASGTLQWCFEPSIEGSVAPAATLAFAGGVVGVGGWSGADDPNRGLGWLVALNPDGGPRWEQIFAPPEAHEISLTSVVAGVEGSTIIVAGYVVLGPGARAQGWLGEFDLDTGALLAERRYADPGGSVVAYALAWIGGRLVIAGAVHADAWVAELDDQLDIAWEQRFDYEGGVDLVRQVLEGPTGQLTVIGVADRSVDNLDAPVPSLGFVRSYASDRTLVFDETLVSAGSSGPSYRFVDALIWNQQVLVGGAKTQLFSTTGHLWAVNGEASISELWAPVEHNGSDIQSLASRPGGAVFVAGETQGRGWLARFDSNLTGFAWEYPMFEDSVVSLAVAVDEPALYGATIRFLDTGGATAMICKLSE